MDRDRTFWEYLLLPFVAVWHYTAHCGRYDVELARAPDPAGDGYSVWRGCSHCTMVQRFDYPNVEIRQVPDSPAD